MNVFQRDLGLVCVSVKLKFLVAGFPAVSTNQAAFVSNDNLSPSLLTLGSSVLAGGAVCTSLLLTVEEDTTLWNAAGCLGPGEKNCWGLLVLQLAGQTQK